MATDPMMNQICEPEHQGGATMQPYDNDESWLDEQIDSMIDSGHDATPSVADFVRSLDLNNMSNIYRD